MAGRLIINILTICIILRFDFKIQNDIIKAQNTAPQVYFSSDFLFSPCLF